MVWFNQAPLEGEDFRITITHVDFTYNPSMFSNPPSHSDRGAGRSCTEVKSIPGHS